MGQVEEAWLEKIDQREGDIHQVSLRWVAKFIE